MPKPVEFESRQQLLEAVSSVTHKAEYARFFGSRFDSVEEAVIESVAGNTFRAFRFKAKGIHDLRPSVLYRAWTNDWIASVLAKSFGIRNREALRRQVIDGAKALDAFWSVKTEGSDRIRFGRAAKLLNLSVKFMTCLKCISADERERLITLLDVPLDSYTLVGVRRLLPQLAIPSNATMGFVDDEAHYIRIQDAIAGLCAPDFLPVHYEIAAWNLGHVQNSHLSRPGGVRFGIDSCES